MTKRPLYALARRYVAPGVLFAALSAAPVAAQGPPCAPCIAIVILPGQAVTLPESLAGLDVLVRMPAGVEAGVALAFEAIARKGGRPGLLIDGVSAAAPPMDTVRQARTIVVGLDAGAEAGLEAAAFALKTRLTALRGALSRGAILGFSTPAGVVDALMARDLAAYADFVVVIGDASIDSKGLPVWRQLEAVTTVRLKPDATEAHTAGGAEVRLKPDATGITLKPDAMRTLLQVTMTGAAERWIWPLPAPSDDGDHAVRDLVRAVPLLPAGLVASPDVRVSCGGAGAYTYLNPQSLETIAYSPSCAPGSPVSTEPPATEVERIDLSSGETLIRLPAPGGAARIAEGVQVVGARTLTVDEIIARHQAAAARQASHVHERISSGTLTLSFEAPGFPAPIAISSQAILYVSRDRTELEQRAIRVNGIEFKEGGIPRLPIIEPERVAAPPLTITLTGVYRYRLAGEETIAGTRCYVVAFEPIDRATPLFRGRAWIAMDGFAMVKVAATETALRGAIVASEQTDEFREMEPGIWLLARSDVRQTYEGAAHHTPIHRVLSLTDHAINPPDFAARRAAAYASASVMLRDTPQGYRYLRRHPPGSAAGTAAAEPAVAGRANRVRTLAAGVIVDPNITRPLPFAGLSYVDFDVLGTGAQLNLFFGGTYGQFAFSIPSVGGSRWQLAGRAFGIASSYNDRSFAAGREQYDEDIRQRPSQASVWLLRPLTPRISLRVGYDLDYTQLKSGEATAADFQVPGDQIVHGARVALDAQRDGWNGSVWWNPAARQGWRPWGRAASGVYDPTHRDFQRYGVSLARSAVLSPRLVARAEGAWMAGRDLDRFSRYSFGTFDNRLRGYPSALIRYDRGGVARGALAWAAGTRLRVDGFADSALVHDPGFGRGLRNYTGLGAAIEVPAPFGTLLAAEWGYGFRGVNADGTLGTQVIRISGFKVF